MIFNCIYFQILCFCQFWANSEQTEFSNKNRSKNNTFIRRLFKCEKEALNANCSYLKQLSSVPLRVGTKEPRSLVQAAANPPELRMARHSSAGTITKKERKKKSVFRNAEQSKAEQSRFKEKERGAPSPGLNRVLNRHPHRLFWDSDTVTAWAGVCKEMAADEKEPNPQNAWEKYQSEATNSWHFVVSPTGDMIIYCIEGTL